MNNENQTEGGVPVELNLPGDRPSRRQAMQWVLAAVAASTLPRETFGDPTAPQHVGSAQPAAQEATAQQPAPVTPGGYGTDPKLTPLYQPGAFWPLTLTEAQKKTSDALVDVILPEDEYGPAASTVGVTPMIDEWVSAPYPAQKGDRPVIVNGLTWIEAESTKRFQKGFADLSTEQKRAICDDICYTATARKEFKTGAQFFSRFRSLAAGAYYSTAAGWKAIGYVGNVPMAKFDGPPAEVLEKLGVTQTVL